MESGPRVLIVDDAVDVCQSLELQLLDFGVSRAEWRLNGEDALALVEAQPARFDAIFIDLNMPGMDGLELMHHLSEMQYRGGIVIISALGEKTINFTLEVVSSYHLRLLGSIEKPFDESLVAFMVRRIKNTRPPALAHPNQPRRKEVMSALRERRVVTYYQPKISCIDNNIIGFECMSRLDNGEGEIIGEQRFMPVVERFQLMDLLLECQLENLGREIKTIQSKVDGECAFSINIFPQQTYNDSLPELLLDLAQAGDIPISSLCLEIPENQALMEDKQLKNINRLAIAGFKLSLDNYGAGYASMRKVKRLPFSEVKLSSDLIEGLSKDKVMKIVVEAIRKETDRNDVFLVALGVVLPEDLLCLADINVDAYQGRLFCPPKSIDELLTWIPYWYESQTLKPWH